MSGGTSASSLAKTLAIGAQGVGAVVSGVAAYQKSRSDRDAYAYQAQVAENNALAAKWSAEDAITRGQTEVNRQQLKSVALKGTQRAALAARGLDIAEGSALAILADTDLLGEIDANTIADNAARESWALRTQATSHSANAELLRYRASLENPAGALTGSLLTGASSVASSWLRMSESMSKTKSKPYTTGSFDFPTYG